jgi:hypothetical protein
MSHKAFAFDWNAFDLDLGIILLAALDTDDGAELAEFIEQERSRLTDPYNGDPLPADWRGRLEAGDVQELADFALTRYYRVRDDRGVGSAWLGLGESLSAEQARALLGAPFGAGDRLFDPGRLGSYFQSPAMARESLEAVAGLAAEEVQPFRELLAECVARRLGAYVTF